MSTRVKRISAAKLKLISAGTSTITAPFSGVVVSTRECANALVASIEINANVASLFITCSSVNSVGALNFADVGDNHGDIATGQTLYRRHVAKPPVMASDA